MRCYPSDKYDKEEAKRIGAKDWQIALLKLNPGYVHWGPHEDYMWTKKDGGWTSPILIDSWKEFTIELDELNEVVNFYFEVDRDGKQCPTCGGNGYHPDAHWVSESFYQHSSPFARETYDQRRAAMLLASFSPDTDLQEMANAPYRDPGFPSEETLSKYGPEFRKFCEDMRNGDGCWHDKITEDEVKALYKSQRLHDSHKFVQGEGWKKNPDFVMPTAEQVNAINKTGRGLDCHDGINRGVLIDARCERLGIPKTCPDCEGHGHVFTAPETHINLVLWLIHPRKGASRGLEVKHIVQEDLPAIFKFLKGAAKRNAQRFAKVVRQKA